eukprot:TRINITY_DN50866_c0_g1_i1.p1 TRINITY_DN50866_c0_g1~~TRINITY_DN50866_c0_g1_i1.p1  ORF type:complete len:100 (+),score=3.91 TRINITY_DN50866_c0_g1_i1:501-800(+)
MRLSGNRLPLTENLNGDLCFQILKHWTVSKFLNLKTLIKYNDALSQLWFMYIFNTVQAFNLQSSLKDKYVSNLRVKNEYKIHGIFQRTEIYCKKLIILD